MAEIQIKEVPAVDVMSLAFTGAYEQTGDRLDDLLSWMLRAGHPYSDRPLGLFHDDPAKVPQDELRAEVCLPVEEGCQGYEEVERKRLPATTVACMQFTGPYRDLQAVYAEIYKWVSDNGYRAVEGQPCREVYVSLYGEVEEPAQCVTEVQVPVEKA